MSSRKQAVYGANAVRVLRAVLAGLVAAAFIALVVLMAAVVTASAFIIAGVAALGAGAFWLYRKIRGGRSDRDREPRILVARRGPHGWTVEGDNRPNEA
ncbi:hypothetical protein DDZ18_08745 [Marinicauda salina]|uniref:Uncharacterized protein n=1 Tax=Marinicauda salina TaxID=2135793 RepID=A0A2U2BUQ2_9PROT|nr:hypothetical protein [Marinicauda salina]PWE17732.1 hypothetical protein DDZ18_08745 [Marinicauda salina]